MLGIWERPEWLNHYYSGRIMASLRGISLADRGALYGKRRSLGTTPPPLHGKSGQRRLSMSVYPAKDLLPLISAPDLLISCQKLLLALPTSYLSYIPILSFSGVRSVQLSCLENITSVLLSEQNTSEVFFDPKHCWTRNTSLIRRKETRKSSQQLRMSPSRQL
jgi:hypothetical protein